MKTFTCQVELSPLMAKHGQVFVLYVTRPDRAEVARLGWMNVSVLKGIYPAIYAKCYTGAVEFTTYELHTISCLANGCWADKYMPKPLARTEFLEWPKFLRRI